MLSKGPVETVTPHPLCSGTAVASIIGGKDHGLAPKVNIVSVGVTDSTGIAKTSDIIAGFDKVAEHQSTLPAESKGMAVANLSINGAIRNPALDDATEAVSARGFLVPGAATTSCHC